MREQFKEKSVRIKSYFDSSVQTAMRQARHEFGDDVMLVTSRITSPEFRYLGEFEVVFAVDENDTGSRAAAVTPPPAVVTAGFADVLSRQLESRAAPAEGVVANIQSLLLEMGLEPTVAEAVATLIRSCPARGGERPLSAGLAPEPFEAPVCLAPPVELPGNLFLAPTCAEPESEIVSGDQTPLIPFPIEIAVCELPGKDGETELLLSARCSDQMPVAGAQTDSQAVDEFALSRPVRAPRVRPQSGFTMMLIAFGLYGVMRRSGS